MRADASFHCGGDCDDGRDAIQPGATESCDGWDNGRDGPIDEGVLQPIYPDVDGDGFGVQAGATEACGSTGSWTSPCRRATRPT